MAAATYTTDMTSINDGQSGTYVEMTGWANGGTPQVNTTEWYIQGTGCVTATMNNKTTIQSIAFNNGSDLSGSFGSGDVLLMWQVCLAGGALATFSSGGLRFIEGQTQAIFKAATVSGRDYGKYPYGGWANVAYASQIETLQATIDVNGTNGTFTRSTGSFLTDGFEPAHAIVTQGFTNAGNNSNFVISTVTATVITVTDNTGMVTETGGGNETIVMGDYLVGTLSGTRAAQYFGSGLIADSAVSKGEMHCVDEIAYGRAEIIALNGDLSNGYANFDDMATENDYNDATNGYNRWGLFSLQEGRYVWKGLMTVGQAATTVDFRDSDRDIFIDDTPRTYANFNKIEINNASSNVEWTRINFTSVNESGLSLGRFEMVDNATVSMTGCKFTGMDTFIFQSNATLTSSIFLRCGQVTHGGADFEECEFTGYEGTAGTAYLTYAVNADPDGELDNCSFTKGTAATHAIEFDATNTPTTITLRGIDFSGYNASNGQNDSTLYFPSTTKSYTVNLIGCTGNISYRVGSGGSVNLVTNPVTFTVTVKDSITKAAIDDAQILVWVSDGTNYPYQASVTITSSGTTATVTHNSHGLSTNDNVIISGDSTTEEAYVGAYTITVTGANTYTYTMAEAAAASPATGTITSTFAVINANADASGQASDSRTYSTDQDVEGWARRASSSPYYRQGEIDEIIDSTDGRSVTIFLIKDE